MLFLFSGDDSKKKYAEFEKFLSALKKGTEVFSFNKNNFPGLEIRNFYNGEGLFFSESVIIFENLLEKEDTASMLFEELDSMQKSKSIFVFLESKLNKTTLDIFKKNRGELNIFELPKEKKEKFNNFLLADALGARNKVNLWVNYRLAVDLGVGLEELVGVLFWKVKDMILRKDFSKFSKTELVTISSKLSYLLPEARREGKDAESAMEQFLLESL